MYLGGPQGWWCYAFERIVKQYMAIGTNEKNIELTYARVTARLDAVRFFYLRNGYEVDNSFLTKRLKRDPGHWLRTIYGAEALVTKLHYDTEEWYGVDSQKYRIAKALLRRRYAIGRGGVSVTLGADDMAAVLLHFSRRLNIRDVNSSLVECFTFSKGIYVGEHAWKGWRYRVGEPLLFKAIWSEDDVVAGRADGATYVCKMTAVYVCRYNTSHSTVFFRGVFYDDVGGGRSNPWNDQLLVTPARRTALSTEYYPYSLLPASFIVRPCMLVSLPKSQETSVWSGEAVETPVFSVNDFMRPLNPAKYFRSDCITVPPFPVLDKHGNVSPLPLQVAGRADERWGYTTWGVIKRYNKEDSSIHVQILNSVGRGGAFQGQYMQRHTQSVYEQWKLFDTNQKISHIVPGVTHSRIVSWTLA
jgi:hypothetical protein